MEGFDSGTPIRSRTLTDTWSRIAREVAATESALNKWLEGNHRIGLTEYRASLLIRSSPDQELRINELAHQLGLNQSSVTRLVERMERKGLAFRDICPDDGRGIYASLTENGLNMLDSIGAEFEEKLLSLMANIGEDWLLTELRSQTSEK